MPGSVGSPNSELAIAYVQCGKSPKPLMTCPLRHSGAETIFLGSVMPSVWRLLARFTQPAASLYGTTTSAVCAPAAVSTEVRSVWLSGYPTDLTLMPAALSPALIAAAPTAMPALSDG